MAGPIVGVVVVRSAVPFVSAPLRDSVTCAG
jgi:hypothetical protein